MAPDLPTSRKLHVASCAEDLVAELHTDKEYPALTTCWRCEQSVGLQDVQVIWPVANIEFAFTRIPGYECKPCGETYFPAEVLDALAKCVDEELAVLKPQPEFRNPDRLMPAKVWSSGAERRPSL